MHLVPTTTHPHDFQEDEGASDVVVVVQEWLLCRLSNSFEASKVDHIRDVMLWKEKERRRKIKKDGMCFATSDNIETSLWSFFLFFFFYSFLRPRSTSLQPSLYVESGFQHLSAPRSAAHRSKDLGQRFLVQEVDIVECAALASDLLHAPQRLCWVRSEPEEED